MPTDNFQKKVQKALQQQYYEQKSHNSISQFQIIQITNGDLSCVQPLFEDFCNNQSILSENPVRNKRYLLISTLTLLSRYAISMGVNKEEVYISSDLYIQRSDTCQTVQEIEKLFYEILVFYIRKIQLLLSLHYSKPVCQAINYISEHLYETISVKDLCIYVGYSTSYFSALFKKETNNSIIKYIHQLKIEQACKLLISSSLSLNEISNNLAYSSLSHFIGTFKKITGTTPQAYRKTAHPHMLSYADGTKKQ